MSSSAQSPSIGPSRVTYAPTLRTGLVMCGTGAHGAYHAGVLRALQEAGVKIDLVAGQGIGAGAAALAAIDGAACLWEAGGLWRSHLTRGFFSWKPLLRLIGFIAIVVVAVLAVPLAVLAAGAVVYAFGFLLILIGVSAGTRLVEWCSAWLRDAFSSGALPVTVPRFAMAVVVVLVVVASVGSIVERWRAPARRRSAGGWWWELIGAPLVASGIRRAFIDAIWKLIRGAHHERPSLALVGRRYAEVLSDSLTQPGFRELVVLATDLDTRCDLVVALLSEPYRREFLAARPGRDRQAEVIDLAGVGRDHGLEIVAAAMTPPMLFEPALVTFSSGSFWRGETHRVSDRPGSILRLLEEVANAGARQAIVVSAVAAAQQPHRLSAPRFDPRHRVGDAIAAAECAALRDGLEAMRDRFDAIYVITPAHNAVGPFDFSAVYDEASDRRQPLDELVQLGYEDAYRQFVEPVVATSGEHLARARTGELRLGF